ncbi:hypothetical protein MLD38_026544 [Melastoma candidum]|uniref:Uncharacterized protein n=1 Tax=Melastoma candidum TaxID=119954 RepID=A0ACB9NZZ2_9MYRT|nr:hypothetical protein MLD38_026544 [Melastoma candidum]
MCLLCVIQKWTRWVAALLPWLVIPLIALWALSKLLPTFYRFEITYPRLACALVLLVTLFWYEILMPKLSSWRARRSVRLRERLKNEAIELQKLRRTATRRCRNCKTPYRDQYPGGGKFMCYYCGHVSRRPVLELPVSPGMGMSNSGLIKELAGKGGKALNRLPEHGWMCGQDWMENGSLVDGSFSSQLESWRRNGNGVFDGDDHCMTEKSYSGFLICCCKVLTSFILSVRWLWRKVSRNSSVGKDEAFDAEHRGMLADKRVGMNFHESRGEKARRKAEEKRQARLERELLEEEERKLREEVSRLVEEQRKLRDEKVDAEKGASPTRDKDCRKETEKKRVEKKKERDRGSNQSNSDWEDLEMKVNKETDLKLATDKQAPSERRDQKSTTDSTKGQTINSGRGFQNMPPSNSSRGTAGSRYLDRMKGSLLSSSKAFSGGSFFGRTPSATAATQQEIKPVVAQSHGDTSIPKRDYCPPENMVAKIVMNVEDRNSNRLVNPESQPMFAPKKSRHQLFTPSTSLTLSSDSSKRAISNFQDKTQTPLSLGHSVSSQACNNPISFGLPSSSLPTYQSKIASGSLGLSNVVEPVLPCIGENDCKFLQDEPELFEDPCHVPDHVALLGPISQSLENFRSDLGVEVAHVRKNVVSPELIKPSPIESPLSRSRGAEDRNPQFSRAPGACDINSFPVVDAVNHEQRPWQLWDSTPLLQEDLSLISNPDSWLVNGDRGSSAEHDFLQSSSQTNSMSLFVENPSLPHMHVISGPFSPLSALTNQDPWAQKSLVPPLSNGNNWMPEVPTKETTHCERFFGSFTESGLVHGTRLPTNSLSKEWQMQDSSHVRDGVAPQTYSASSGLVDRKKRLSFSCFLKPRGHVTMLGEFSNRGGYVCLSLSGDQKP